MINIKATTTERLGFIGRKEGLAALALGVRSPLELPAPETICIPPAVTNESTRKARRYRRRLSGRK